MSLSTESRTLLTHEEARKVIELHALQERLRDRALAQPSLADVAETLQISEAEASQLLAEVRRNQATPAVQVVPRSGLRAFMTAHGVPRWAFAFWAGLTLVLSLITFMMQIDGLSALRYQRAELVNEIRARDEAIEQLKRLDAERTELLREQAPWLPEHLREGP